MNSIVNKILLSIVLILIISFFGFIVTFVTAFIGGVKFYAPLVIAIAVVLIIYTVLKIFGIVKPEVLTRILLSFFAICALAVTGYEINQAYHASFATVNDRDVMLHEYKPFKENTKAVSLEEPSTFKIEGDLPRLDGATALYPLYSAFVQATYPEKEYDIFESKVMSNKTGDAYTNLINGEVDIIFVAGPSRHQLADAETKGVELKLTPIGYEAFVFFVNSKNKVTELSTNQIQDIYSGKITNWAELGGSDDKIRAFQRPENSGSQTMLQKVMDGKDLMTPPKEDVASGMGGIIEETSSYRNYKNAIGFSFLFFATEMIENGKIRLLKVDGINPEKSTIKNKEYPLAAEFYAVTAGSENPNIEAFIEWIQSPQGQYLVEKTGYISK